MRRATVGSVCLLLPLADLVSPASASAQALNHRIDIPGGQLSDALNALSTATGASIGSGGSLPSIRVPRVAGRMTVARALELLLADTGLEAVMVGPQAYRIVARARTARPATPPRANPAVTTTSRNGPDIVVTAQKRPQAYGDVPMSLSVLDASGEPMRVLADDRDLTSSVEGLAMTNLGPGRNRAFIRGVADSPFIGPSQSTVAVQLDNARVTFDAPDPDLRLVDMDRIEILKGPQGPLYGSGALGGILHLVTRKPQFDGVSASARASTETVAHGGLGFGGEVVLNVPLAPDRLAIRAVGYDVRGGGWIDETDGRRNGNVQTMRGGRLAVRWLPATGWTFDLSGAIQHLDVADSQYVTTSDDTLHRSPRAPEPADNDFREAAATLSGRLADLDLTSSTSYVDHRIDQTFDASATTPVAAERQFVDNRGYSLFNQEIRLSRAGRSGWIAGVSFLRATSRARGTFTTVGRMGLAEDLHRVVTEWAVFGEKTVPLAERLSATGGVRLFRTRAEDEAVEQGIGIADTVGKTILSPSIALAWKPRTDVIVFARYARALRPGGLAPSGTGTSKSFDADELGTLDVGIRSGDDAEGFSYSFSAFLTNWNDVQSDYLLLDGLISTRNAGRARIVGAEGSLDWRPTPRTRISVGLSGQDARLTRNDLGQKLDDRRLPVSPDLTARISLARTFTIGAWHSVISGQANYVGRSRLAFDQDIDRAIGRYAVASIGSSFSHDRLTLAAAVDNVFDTTGDTFAFGNPFTIRATRQFVPLRPRTITLSVGRRF